MSDYLFFTLLVAGALWTIGRTIREAAWTGTPEAAEERKQAAPHARFVEGLKQGKRNARREKWGARLAWMNTVAAAFPDWMFKETRSEWAGLILRVSGFALFVGFLYAIPRGWLG